MLTCLSRLTAGAFWSPLTPQPTLPGWSFQTHTYTHTICSPSTHINTWTIKTSNTGVGQVVGCNHFNHCRFLWPWSALYTCFLPANFPRTQEMLKSRLIDRFWNSVFSQRSNPPRNGWVMGIGCNLASHLLLFPFSAPTLRCSEPDDWPPKKSDRLYTSNVKAESRCQRRRVSPLCDISLAHTCVETLQQVQGRSRGFSSRAEN